MIIKQKIVIFQTIKLDFAVSHIYSSGNNEWLEWCTLDIVAVCYNNVILQLL